MTPRRIAIVVSATLGVATLAGCGGGDDDPVSQAEFAEELASGEGGVDDATADCIAEHVYGALDDDELEKLTPDALNRDEAPSQAIGEALTSAIAECTAGGGDSETDDATDDDAAGTVEGGTAAEVPQEICDAYTAWEQSGDSAELAIVQGFAQEAGMTDAADAADFLLSDPPTETADEQSAHEGAVDLLRGELVTGGCAFG